VDVRHVAARERVQEPLARERRVRRVVQRAVLGVRLHGRLQRREAVRALGENGERREDARVRPLHVVGDEAVRRDVLKVRLRAAERKVLHRAHAPGDRVKVVAEAERAARERLHRAELCVEAHRHGHDARGRRRVAAEKEVAQLKVRVERADAARIQVVHDALEQRGHHLGGGKHGSGGHLGGGGLEERLFVGIFAER